MRNSILLAAVVPFLLAGCFSPGTRVTGSRDAGEDPADSELHDEAQFQSLTQQLFAKTTKVVSETREPSNLSAAGGRMFWLDGSTFTPQLNSYDPLHGTALSYAFSISAGGGGDGFDFDASPGLVVNAAVQGEAQVFRAYQASAANTLFDSLQLAAPADGTAWFAYSVDGANVYYVDTNDGVADLYRWTPGSGSAPTRLFGLTQIGIQLGELQAIQVTGDVLFVIEGGRLWKGSLAAQQASWVHTSTEVSGASGDDQGTLAATAMGPFYVADADGSSRDVASEVASSGYALNATYDQIHFYDSGGVLYRQRVYYLGEAGLFAYDLTTWKVTPLLFDVYRAPPEVSIHWSQLTLTEDGTLFVYGAMSTDGAVGATGAIFSLPTLP